MQSQMPAPISRRSSLYKFCLLTAGKGTRNVYAKDTNKALLPVGDKLAISHIIDKVPQGIEIVVAVGYNATLVENYLLDSIFDWSRDIHCKEVKYEGRNVGPGSSLLECAPYLQCPFIFTACDTIVLGKYPVPDINWIGIAPVIKSEPYLTVAIDDNKVTKVYDKIKDSPSMLASIGVVGVHDYKEFWKGLAKPTMTQGEYQTTSGLNALIPKNLVPMYFTWFDTGTTEGYEYANRFFSKPVSK